MNRFWTPLVRRLHPYVPGEQPADSGLVKLNTNENPYGPSPQVLEAIRAATTDDLRLYPDPLASDLRRAIADSMSLTANNVFVGNGSDEVLAMIFQAFFTGDGTLLFPDISYSFYPVYCNLFGVQSRLVPLRGDMSLSLEDFDTDNCGIIFPNPNAPTSLALGMNDIKHLLARNTDSVVVIDEAYVDFGAESAVGLVSQFPNLLVTQTFSKSRSLAGMRAGFAIGDAGLIEALFRVKDSFNSYPLDRLAQAAALAAIKDQGYFEETRQKIMSTRQRATDSLRERGYTVLESSTNFLFLSHPEQTGQSLYQLCRDQRVLVRHWNTARIESFIRVTVGTDQEMAALLARYPNLQDKSLGVSV